MTYLYRMLSLVALVCLSTASTAQTTSTPEIRAVAVYAQGAYIVRADTLQLSAGPHSITIEGLETSLYVETLQPSLGSEVVLEGFNIEIEKVASPEVLAEADSMGLRIDSLTEYVRILEAERMGVVAALDVLAANRTVTASVGVDVNELIVERSITYAQQVQRLEAEKLLLNYKIDRNGEKLFYLEAKKQVLLQNIPSTGKITLDVTVPNDGEYHLTLSYLNPDARWQQTFDAYFTSADSAYARAVMSAEIQQSTGVQWKEVAIELHTGNPLTFRTLEELQNHRKGGLTRLRDLRNKVANSVQSSADGFEGVSIRGGRTDATQYVIDGIRVTGGGLPPETTVHEWVGNWWTAEDAKPKAVPKVPEVAEHLQLTSSKFSLPGEYSLSSGAKQLTLKLNQRRLPLHYQYRAQPLLTPIAYLEAVLEDSTLKQLNLVNQEVRLYHEDRFLGSTKLVRPEPNEPVIVGLGPDERVVAQSEQAPGYPHKGWFGGQRRGIDVYLTNATDRAIDQVLEGSGIKSARFKPRAARIEVDGKSYDHVPSPVYKLGAGEKRLVEVRWRQAKWVD